MTLADFQARVQDGIEMVASGWRTPDADLAPMLHVEGPTGAAVLPVLGERGEAGEHIVKAIIAHRAQRAAFVGSGWMSLYTMPRDPQERERVLAQALATTKVMPPSRDPDRIEIAIAAVADATTLVASRARILRSPDAPPTLGAWEHADASLGGRMTLVLRLGLDIVARM